MRVIEIYLIRQIFIVFCLIFFASISIAWIIQVLEHINFLTGSGKTFWILLKFSLFLIPSTIPIALPFVIILSLIYVLNSLQQNSELIIVHCTQGGYLSLIKSVLSFAIAVGIISFISANFLVPYSRLNMRIMTKDLQSTMINVLLKPGNFQTIRSDLIIRVGLKNSNTSFSNIFIADQRNPKIDFLYYAKYATFGIHENQPYFLMVDGQIKRQEKTSNAISLINFKRYYLKLTDFMIPQKKIYLYTKDLSLMDLLHKKNHYTKFTSTEYTVELHKRLTDWMYPILFSLIGLFFCAPACSPKNTQNWKHLLSLTFCFLYFFLGSLGHHLSQKYVNFSFFLYLFPMSGICIFLYALIKNYNFILSKK